MLGLSVTGLAAVLALLEDRPPFPPVVVPPTAVLPADVAVPPAGLLLEAVPPVLTDRLPPPETLEPPDGLELLAPAELLDLAEPPAPAPPAELELDCPPEVTPPELVPPAEPPVLALLPPDEEVQPKAASTPRRAKLKRPGGISRSVSVLLSDIVVRFPKAPCR